MFQVMRERSTNDELYFICPWPGCGDQTGNRSVNLRNGKTNCWRCNHGGDFVNWARHLGYVVDEDGTTASVPLEQIDTSPFVPESDPLPIIRDVELPKGFQYCRDKPKSIYTTLIGEMAQRKHLELADVVRAGVGFTKVDPKWEPYAIFPVFESGHVVYWQGRTYVDPEEGSTKLFPNRTECPHGARYWIYNYDELRDTNAPIAIAVESILNVLSLKRYLRDHSIQGIVPVAVFKHYVSNYQMRKLAALPKLKELCLLYDHDATRSSWEKSPKLVNRVSVTVAEMPPGSGGKRNDPNDDVESGWQAFENRESANALNSVLSHINADRREVVVQKERPYQPYKDKLSGILDSFS